jgi:hypothetical protein
VVASRLRGRAVRRASHDSMSLGRFRFSDRFSRARPDGIPTNPATGVPSRQERTLPSANSASRSFQCANANASDFSHPRTSTVVSATDEPLCELALRCKLANVGTGDKMDHLISKAWPDNKLHDIAECIVMLSVLLVVVVAVLRVLGIVR